MFAAFDVIASPQTHESAPSSGATHSTGRPSSAIACVVPRPPSASTTSPDLNRLTIDESDSANERNWSRFSSRWSRASATSSSVMFIGSSMPSASAVAPSAVSGVASSATRPAKAGSKRSWKEVTSWPASSVLTIRP